MERRLEVDAAGAFGSALRLWWFDAARDLRVALRQHRRAPGFAVLVVITLAIGIGANATMAGAIDRLLLRPPPHVRAPERVVRLLLVGRGPAGGEHVSARSSYPVFLDLQRDVPSFETIAAYSPATLSLGAGPDAVEVRATLVTAAFFHVFGVNAVAGRLLVPSDDGASTLPLVVLAHGFWQREFAGDTSIVGRTLAIGGHAYTVAGVAPAGFRGVEPRTPDMWLPLTIAAERVSRLPLSLDDRGSAWVSLVARLREGASATAAEQQATNVWREYNAPPTDPASARRVVTASTVLGRGPDRPREVNIALWLTGVSGLVLLIACANVANLLLVRAYARRQEIAVRLALGAGRGRLARQVLVEGLLLAGAGGGAALLLAVAGGWRVQGLLASDGAPAGLVDLRLFGFVALVALGTGVLISLAPLLQARSVDLTSALRAGGAITGGRGSGVRAFLLGTQAALCMMLLIAAGLFATSLRRVKGLDLGVDLERTLMASIDLGRATLPRSEIQATYEAMLQRVRAVAGVRAVALGEHDPYSFGQAVAAHTPQRSAESLWHEGVAEVPMEAAVDSNFFTAVGARSLRGRDFASGDRRGAPRVAIINDRLAKLLWPDEDALGKCMLVSWTGGACVTVVGVTHGFWKNSILDRDRLVVYVPLAQADRHVRAGSMFIATSAGSANREMVIRAVRQAIQGVRPDLPAVRVVAMRDVVGPQYRPWQLASTMFSLFGVVSLLIAIIGLYAVVSFTAARRAREIAIRIALGGRPAHVLSVVAHDAVRAVCAGLVIGTLAALALRHWLGPLLFQTSPGDPGIIAGVGALLLLVAFLASLVPTIRVLRRTPSAALRVD